MKVEIDTKEVAAKLAFLVGKTILFRTLVGDSTTATNVLAVKAENTPGTAGIPLVSIYTTVGVKNIEKSSQFGDFIVLGEDGESVSLASYADALGICF